MRRRHGIGCAIAPRATTIVTSESELEHTRPLPLFLLAAAGESLGGRPVFGSAVLEERELIYFFNPACQFCITVNCCGPLWLTGTAARKRFPSPAIAAVATLTGS